MKYKMRSNFPKDIKVNGESRIMKDKRQRTLIYILGAVALGFVVLFLFQGLNANNYQYNLSKRIPKVLAIAITGGAIGFSSTIFQTLTGNRILTPSTLGLDSLYGFFQTFVVFIFGTSSILMKNSNVNFIASAMLMLIATMILYKVVFNEKRNMFFLLLVGTVMGTLFRSMSTFMQVIMDPNEFDSLQSKLFASFSNINVSVLLISVIIILIVFAMMYDDVKNLDVLMLGREHAINLGVDYKALSKKILVAVAILVSVSTALVGSITFLGVLVTNLTYESFKTYKHKYLLMGSSLISIIALVGGQFIVERVLDYNSKISIIINFIGGIYFIYLLLKESKL